MKRADTAFSVWVRSRGVCESDRDSHTQNLQCAHIISRSYRTTRTYELNALCLCQGCHVFYTHRPLEWRLFIDDRFPGRWDDIQQRALTHDKVDWKAEAEHWESQSPLVSP